MGTGRWSELRGISHGALTVGNLGGHLVLGHHQVLGDGGQVLIDRVIRGHPGANTFSLKYKFDFSLEFKQSEEIKHSD